MASNEQIQATIDGYIDAYVQNNKAAFLALWAPDGVLEDPVGTPAHVGKDALGAFWDGARELADRIILKLDRAVIAGGEAAVTIEINAHMGEGGLAMPAVDIMRFNDDGLLTSVRAYWDMSTATPLEG
ncbi:MAG: nuclear transport factor 2 family protein [Acidimicrobiia bacterium]